MTNPRMVDSLSDGSGTFYEKAYEIVRALRDPKNIIQDVPQFVEDVDGNAVELEGTRYLQLSVPLALIWAEIIEAVLNDW